MSEKFSATLRIGDLSDFIAPSQACIVSLKGLKTNPTKPDKAEVFCHNFSSFFRCLFNFINFSSFYLELYLLLFFGVGRGADDLVV
jgi:hypothetical protein